MKEILAIICNSVICVILTLQAYVDIKIRLLLDRYNIVILVISLIYKTVLVVCGYYTVTQVFKDFSIGIVISICLLILYFLPTNFIGMGDIKSICIISCFVVSYSLEFLVVLIIISGLQGLITLLIESRQKSMPLGISLLLATVCIKLLEFWEI